MSHTRKILIALAIVALGWTVFLLSQPADSSPAEPAALSSVPQVDHDREFIHQHRKLALDRARWFAAAQRAEDEAAWYAAAAEAEARAAQEAEERAEAERQARAARKAEEARRAAESAPVAAAAAAPAPGSNYERFLRLADCESGQRDKAGNPIPGTANWHINTGNGYYGGLQFSLDTWRRAGGTGYPHEHSRDTQIAIAESWLAKTSWSQWPDCSRRLGYR